MSIVKVADTFLEEFLPYAHYKCNDDASNTIVTDDGTGANNGVASTNTDNLSVAGKINEAFEFNGSSEFVNLDAFGTDIASDTIGSFSFWVNPYSSGSGVNMIFSWGEDGGLDQFRFYSSDDVLYIMIRDSDPDNLKYETPLADDTPTHVIITQDGSQLRIIINGVEVAPTKTIDTTPGAWLAFAVNADSGRLGCSKDNSGTDRYFLDGTVDDFRYYKNKALNLSEAKFIYNAGIGTEDNASESSNIITQSIDGDSLTNLLCHFDGTDGATSSVDSSPSGHILSFSGSAQLDTAYKKFGESSLYLPGSSYAEVAHSDEFEFGAGDFTVDWWEYRIGGDVNVRCALSREYLGSSTKPAWVFGMDGGNGSYTVWMTNSADWDMAYGKTLGGRNDNVWNHFAVVRSGTTFYTFKNGIQKDTWTDARALRASTGDLQIGRQRSAIWVGHMDELRVSKGIARWTTGFTPPTNPYEVTSIGKILGVTK